jgi:threonine/homoserine/homoserine lactone efflux protein
MDTRQLAIIGIAAIITLGPGPDMALVTRMPLARGKSAASLTSLGIVTGLLISGIASAAGIAALLNASATLYTILRLAGAAYLILLGLHAILARTSAPDAIAEPSPSRRSGIGAYGQGLLNNLLNPKIGVFYTAFLPSSSGRGSRSSCWPCCWRRSTPSSASPGCSSMPPSSRGRAPSSVVHASAARWSASPASCCTPSACASPSSSADPKFSDLLCLCELCVLRVEIPSRSLLRPP